MTTVSALALVLSGLNPASAAVLGGANGGPAPTVANDAAMAAAVQAAAMAQRSNQSMQRAVQALDAIRAMQGAARDAAALRPNVPNGLGGLVQDKRTPGLWINANDPVEAVSGGRSTVTVGQTAARAVMTWQRFDVGADTTLVYDQQGNRNWIALNRIDATGSPSRILGQIKADGTVLLINPNGIIFGGGSQVNVNTLIASTHDIVSSALASPFALNSPNYIDYTPATGPTFGVLPNEAAANRYFVDNGLFTITASGLGNSAAFAMGSRTLNASGGGAIEVRPGAIINANANGAIDSGYVALIGPRVDNAGTITARNGQIIMAAASAVVLTMPMSSATGVRANITTTVASRTDTDPSTSVGSVDLPDINNNPVHLSFMNIAPPAIVTSDRLRGGLVTNRISGLLSSRVGAVTLAGETVEQLGGIDVTTAVNRPGSINLVASPATAPAFAAPSFGSVTVGARSVMAIRPEEDGGSIPTGSATPDNFRANLQPRITVNAGLGYVDIQGGAFVKAPSAAMTVSAGAGRSTLLGAGSVIDLSGLAGVPLSMASNFVTFVVTANEVADSPLARGLIGQTVTVDTRLSGTRADGLAWVGSPIVNAAGYANTIPQSIDRLLTAGGSLTVSGGSTFVQMPGSLVNVSGGYVSYAGGMVRTTRLIGSNGRFYDIGFADPSLAYAIARGFVVDHARWRLTEIYDNSLLVSGSFEAGYVAGISAGAVNVAASAPLLAGDVIADIVAGRRQRQNGKGGGTAAQTTLEQLPAGATLGVKVMPSANVSNVVLQPQGTADPYGLSAISSAAILQTTNWTPPLVGNTLPIFTDRLSQSGWAGISITGAGRLDMTSDASLAVRPGGSIKLDGVATIDGRLSAPGGSIQLAGRTPDVRLPASALVIGPHAVLDVHGLWVNDSGYTGEVQGSAFIDGGSVSITTGKASSFEIATIAATGERVVVATDRSMSIVLAPGSLIDVSSGGYVGRDSRFKIGADGLPVGKGGSVSLVTYGGDQWDPGYGSQKVAAGDLALTRTDGTSMGVIRAGTIYYSYDPSQQNPNLGVISLPPSLFIDGGAYNPDRASVVLGGAIRAQGFAGGGTFTLQAPSIRLSDTTTSVASYLHAATVSGVLPQLAALASLPPSQVGAAWRPAGADVATSAGTVVLSPSFFADNAFSNYVLTGTYRGATVVAGTTVALRQSGFLPPAAGTASAPPPTGTVVADFAALGPAPAGLRKPVNLTLQQVVQYGSPAGGMTTAGVVVEAGARIVTEPRGSITLSAANVTTVLGSVVAPGGAITVAGGNGTWIGSGAQLDVSGAFLPDPRVTTYATGALLPAGTITLASALSVVQPGATFLLRGSRAVVDAPEVRDGLLGPLLGSQALWSDGGELRLVGAIGATTAFSGYFAGTVDASGGAPLAAGGTLTIGALDPVSGRIIAPDTLTLQQSGNVAASFVMPAGSTTAYPLTKSQLTAMQPASVGATVALTADLLGSSGFQSATLSTASSGGTIAFKGPVSASLSGALTLSGVLKTGGSVVNLAAGYVRLVGNGNGIPTAPIATSGALNIRARWIDLQGALAVSDAMDVNLTSSGAIRLLPDNYGAVRDLKTSPTTVYGGALIAPGNLTLTAAEIYPVTSTHFLLAALGRTPGANTLTIVQNGAPTAPLSAGGGIYLDAQTIVQGGTLWAPLGTIALGITDVSQVPAIVAKVVNPQSTRLSDALWTKTASVTIAPGSLTSVSAAGLLLPFGSTIDGTAWNSGTYYTTTNATGVTLNPSAKISAPPSKQISLNAAGITTQAGAVIDLSGGGDVYATEFVPGTGGTRNVLASYQYDAANSATGNVFFYGSQYADGRQVYALVPSYAAPVAAYDPSFANYPYYSGQVAPAGTSTASFGITSPLTPIPVGRAVQIPGGHGVPAGTYTLLPGMYATLPGAYRVVAMANNVLPLTQRVTSADGSDYLTGTLVDAITGARSATQTLFQLQGKDTWSQYSRINIATGSSYFSDLARRNGNALPPLPGDGGLLSIGATAALSLASTNRFAPAPGGRGGEAAISADNILIKSASQSVPAGASGYLVLDADQISGLGASIVVIGGSVAFTPAGQTISAAARNLEVLTDAIHPLTGPELLLVTQYDAAMPGANGLTVDAGSVISAVGTVPDGTNVNYTLTSVAAGNLGAALRVSNGAVVDMVRAFAVGSDPLSTGGSIRIGTSAGSTDLASAGAPTLINGGAALAIDSSGTGRIAAGAVLRAASVAVSGGIVSLGNTAGVSGGVVLTNDFFAGLAGAPSVTVRSASVINLYDAGGIAIGDPSSPIGRLAFDAAGLFSAGGSTTISGRDVSFGNSRGSTVTSGALTGSGAGTLLVQAGGTFTEGAGALKLGGLGQVRLAAGQSIGFSGNGGLDAGSAAVTLSTPLILANAGAVQTLTTTGVIVTDPGAGAAPVIAADNFGGRLTVSGASIRHGTAMAAHAGELTLKATTGDVVFGPNALVDVSGTVITIAGLRQNVTAGTARLLAANGNVRIGAGATVDASAAGDGYAGKVIIQTAAAGTATLAGTLKASARARDLGGSFTLDAGSIDGALPWGGFTREFTVTQQHGDLVVPGDVTLTSRRVTLTANDGSVVLGGTIDASGPSGGLIALYGAGRATGATTRSGGVIVGAQAVLNAAGYQVDDPRNGQFSSLAQREARNGGVIVLGTSGTPNGTTNVDLGYQNVDPSGSGRVEVAAGAQLDVSAGTGGVGGQVVVRAPILTNRDVNVSFNGSVQGARSVALNAYATWSTTDGSTSTRHFDGIIDPAGRFAIDGTMVDGTWSNAIGIQLAADAGGRGYTSVPVVTVSGGGGSGATAAAFVAPVTGTGGLTIIDGGSYDRAVTARLDVPDGGGDTPTVAVTMGLRTFVVTNGGSGYQPNTTISFTVGTGGTAALATAIVDATGAIAAIQVNRAGTFNTLPNITLPSPASGGRMATASAAWTVVRVNINFDSSNPSKYSFVPTVTFRCGATACASQPVTTMSLQVTGVALTSPGSGYTRTPTFTIDPSPAGASASATIKVIALTGLSATQTNGVPTLDQPDDSILLLQGTGIFTSTGNLNADHAGFYAGTLVNFVQNPFDTAAVASRFGSVAPSLLRLRPEIVLTNPNAAVNSGNVTVASNWNLGAGTVDGTGKVTLTYRTSDAGEPGVLTLRALNDVQVRATISDGFFATDAAGNLVPDLVANRIDNNPTVDTPNTTSAAAVMPRFGTAFPYRSSFSYNIAAGAALLGDGTTAPAVNPTAVAVSGSSPRGNVIIDGHTSYDNPYGPNFGGDGTSVIFVPTLIRTGTGAITVAAANDVVFIDTDAPGAIYTAGAAAALPDGFTPPSLSPFYTASSNGLVSAPTWTSGGGAVAVSAGGSIIGIETPADPSGLLTNSINGTSGQFWSAWYFHSGKANGSSSPFDGAGTSQTAAWVNFASFFQGIGALGGGDVRLKAGRDITDVSASLPETIAVSGGFMGTNTDANGRPIPIPAQLNTYGGGNLSVEAGGDLNSGAFLVGRGAGTIRVGGAVQVTASNPLTGQRTMAPTGFDGLPPITVAGAWKDVPLLLAVQNGFVDVMAAGPVTLGGVYDPAALPSSLLRGTPIQYLPGAAPDGTNSLWGNIFSSYGVTLPGGLKGASGVSLTSITGDVTVNALSGLDSGAVLSGATLNAGMRTTFLGMQMPATVRLAALAGDVVIAQPLQVVPSAVGTVEMIAAGSVRATAKLTGILVDMIDVNARPDLFVGAPLSADDIANNYINPLGVPVTALAAPLHAGDAQPVRIAAGLDIVGSVGSTTSGVVRLLKPAEITAGRDITNLAFVGENNASEDVTSIAAGRDIVGGQYTIYGPGSLLMSSGRDMGPFVPSGVQSRTEGNVNTINGVIAVGNFTNGVVSGTQSANQTSSGVLVVKPYLPAKSADITLLYGVGRGIDYQGAISRYVDPASAGGNGIDFLTPMRPLLERIYDGRSHADGDATPNPHGGAADAYRFFASLSPSQQHLLLDRVFLDFLAQVARDYRNTSSPYVGQYARAYDAIATLFPASLGYSGTRDVASIPSGTLNLSSAVLQTQQNSDVNVIGPGGRIIVGSNARDVLQPNQEGILTLANGAIRLYADGDITLGQSRVMTEQGGDILVFSGNGDINAGSGPKTYTSNSPLSQICDVSGFCAVNPAGLVSGAGIAAVLTVPGQDPRKSNVVLAAPRGVIDFGAAGVRSANDIVLVANQILNAYNVQAGGSVTGLSTVSLPNLGTLTSAANVAGASNRTDTPAQAPARDAGPSVIMVEVLGFGGGSEATDDDRKKRQSQPSP